ncbi:hypothetical protein JYK02_34445 [Corallococcus macrosporus]|uniref:Uncharacterized protein n=1 Tax=Corallococcus macrosporus TaxID=35 RepID=A0ABS3DMS6_9BACT|nr:hypothetical protein [Corallococcus macrosporus]MBN8232630.1 hypothetical protein [Corallococcus macrosporus]
MPPEEGGTTEPITQPSQEQAAPGESSEDRKVNASGTCIGYDPNTYCLAECNDGINFYYPVGHASVIAFGNCASAAYNYCRSIGYSGHNDACWGTYY